MSELKPGDFIAGEYRVRRVFGGHGKSGMGVVYLVEGRTSEEPFVLKTFQSRRADAGSIVRFKAEAETWINIGKHPNVVQCHWVREFDNQLFVAAEYICPDDAGRNTLTNYLASGLLPLQRQLDWIAHFCFGMKHAMSRGLRAHRDIKPDNLMIDNRGQLKITDFGLAKGLSLCDARPSERTDDGSAWNLTVAGSVFGTPPFMAPEQFLDSSEVDQRADIYSLGVVIYMIASGGKLPIMPATRGEDVFRQWALAHRQQRIIRLDHPLMPLAEKCLEKDRDQRFQSYDEVLDAAGQTCRKHRCAIPKEEQDADAEFVTQWGIAMSLSNLGRAEEAIAKLRTMTMRWPNSSQIYTELGAAYMRLGKWEEAIQATEKSLSLYQYSTAAWNNLGGALSYLGLVKEAKRAFSKSLLIEPENTGAMVGLAAQHMNDGEFQSAKELCDVALFWRPEKPLVLQVAASCYLQCNEYAKATPVLQRLLKANPDDVASWFNLAICRQNAGDVPGQIQALQEVLKRDPKDGQALNSVVQALLDTARFDEALAYSEQLQQVQGWEIAGVCKQARVLAASGRGMTAYALLSKWASLHERNASLWFNMAVILSYAPIQYRPQALTAARMAMICHKEDPTQLTSGNYGVLQKLLADLGDANAELTESAIIRAAKQKLAEASAKFPRTQPHIAALAKLGDAYANEGNLSRAEAVYREAIQIVEAEMGPEFPYVTPLLNNLAHICQSQGCLAEAQQLYERAVAVIEKAYGKDDRNLGAFLTNLGVVYDERGKHLEAQRVYGRALVIKRQHLGAQDISIAVTLEHLAASLAKTGNQREAVAAQNEAQRIRRL